MHAAFVSFCSAQDWDLDCYGVPLRSPPVFNAQGFFDSVNFASAAAFEAYRQRQALALVPYLLNGLDDNGVALGAQVAEGAVTRKGTTTQFRPYKHSITRLHAAASHVLISHFLSRPSRVL